MRRPPSIMGGMIKKGPWTRQEDHLLISFIQEKGPGNWKSVPNSAGLQRLSRSCKQRWTNYLRPGIKRGNFTDEENRKIIHLQSVLGNRWAAIARYLPERTESDIRIYWNKHLKKKVNRSRSGRNDVSQHGAGGSSSNTTIHEFNQETESFKGRWVRTLHTNVRRAAIALLEATTPTRAPGDTLPPAAHGLDSSLAKATPPLHSSDLLNFKPPNRWMNLSSNQQQIPISADHHQLCSPADAQANQTSSNPIYSYPYSAKNIAQLLQGWNKESHKSGEAEEESAYKKEDNYPESSVTAGLGHVSGSNKGNDKNAADVINNCSIKINSPNINVKGMVPTPKGDNNIIPPVPSMENSMLHYNANYNPPPLNGDPAPSAFLGGEYKEVDDVSLLDISTSCDLATFWSLF